MLFKLVHVIDRAARDVPAVLWSPRAVRRMRSALERFPALDGPEIGPVRWGVIGLELRLRAGADQVDLTFPLLAEDRDAILATARADGGAWLHETPYWCRVAELCGLWADAEGPLRSVVKLLWLELDMDGARQADGVTPPGVFVRFQPQATAAPADLWRDLLSRVLATLAGQAPPEWLFDGFERCRRNLPVGAHVQYVGLMLSRGAQAVRFVFSGPADADWACFLHACGFPRTQAGLRRDLAGVTTASGRVVHQGPTALQLDLGPAGVVPRFGCELVLDRRAQLEGTIAERELLENLAASGLCCREKLAALYELPGRHLDRWGDVCLVGHSRQVHHLKVVFEAHGPVESKAYYGRALTIERFTPGGGPASERPEAPSTLLEDASR